ncbi:DsbA family protein [Sedimentitalea sp. XS_ASV28]|uniref:DsbA family protein n=1 Tax=Sedimentitalea sp. XS_ASV28 TaxID=3241296 RepID=UPI003516B138
MSLRRRDILIAAGLVGATIALPRLANLFRPEFTFEPIPGLPGFRRISGQAQSSAPPVFSGIEPVDARDIQRRRDVASDPCGAAFGSQRWPDGHVPVAVFTDYNCPYCPALSAIVIDLITSGAPVSVTWHDLPVLGPRSEAAARAAIAADAQGRYLPVHEHLMRAVLRPGSQALRSLAERFDLDADRFLRDEAGPETRERLAHSDAVAKSFGIFGTPSMLVGRTLVIGQIDRDRFESLIAIEQELGMMPCGSPGGVGAG